MLRRLRTRMAMLNVAISGAILIAMALAALNVSEGMIADQYERDLQQNTSVMVTTMQSVKTTVNIAFASGYSVYVRNGDEAQIVSSLDVEDETLAVAIGIAQEALEAHLGQDVAADMSGQEDVLVQRFFVTGFQGDNGDGKNSLYLFRQQTIYTLPNLLIEANHKSYRVSVMAAAGEPVQQVFVLQDRTAELAAVASLRWLFAGCVLGGLVLTGFASLYLSTRSIRPVEQSLSQQRAFIAAASHELRTPVAAVRANAEVLSDAPIGDFAPYLDAITQESARMSHLVSDLMDLARADAGELQVIEETVDAAETMRRAGTLLAPVAERKGHSLEFSGEGVLCRADGDRLCQVLVILLDNAIRYTQENGRIRLSASREGQTAYVRVTDNGPGIPDEYKAKVFERFFRLDAARPADGCGLGLSVAWQLTTRMHGALTLTDAPDGGCVFQVSLRAAK